MSIEKARPRGSNNNNNGNSNEIGTITVGLRLTIGYHCYAEITSGHAGCLPPKKTPPNRQGRVCRAFFVTLELEELVTNFDIRTGRSVLPFIEVILHLCLLQRTL